MNPVDEMVARLEQISTGDHNRGCQGREYSCDCGYDNNNEKAAVEAIALIRSQHAETKRQFNMGYIIACCNLTNLHDEPSMAFDVLEQLGVSRTEVKAMGLSEYDTKALSKIERSCPSRTLYADGRRARAALKEQS